MTMQISNRGVQLLRKHEVWLKKANLAFAVTSSMCFG
jgi:hypothetical protein